MSSFDPGDITVNQCMISGAGGGGVDISRRIMDFSIYEAMTKPYNQLVMTVVDDADILNTNVNLNGQNTLQLSFNQPGMNPYTGNFLLMSIEKSVKLETQRTAIYKMTGFSKHMANPVMVTKSYKEQPLTQVAGDLVKNFLGAQKPLKIGASSSGLAGNQRMPFNINDLGVMKAIKQAIQRANSTQDASSAYVFFENNKNMIIDTLENLLKTAQGSSVATYIQRPMGQNWLRDGVLQQFTILELEEEARVDATSQAQGTSQKVNTFDFATHGFQSILKNFGGALGGGGGGAKSKHMIPYHGQRLPTFAKNFLPARRHTAGVFDSQAVTIKVMFNSALTAGCGFNVQTLAPPGDTTLTVPDKLAGPLLATEVRHMVRFDHVKPQGVSIVRGVKGTLSQDVV